jgi:hypothetical protein
MDLSNLVSTTGGNWNDIAAVAGFTPGLVDFNTGAATGVSIDGTGSPWLNFVGDDAGAFPNQDWFVQPATVDGAGLQADMTGSYRIQGLTGSNYRVEIISARTCCDYLNTFTVDGVLANRTFTGAPVVTPWGSLNDGLIPGNWLIWDNVVPVAGQLTITDVSGPGTLGILNAMRILELPDEEKCFDQPPDPFNAPFSDADCDACGGGPQVLAENFNLGGPADIDVLRFWGAYFPDVPLAKDKFTVVFWDTDATGLPLNIIRKYPPTDATTRVATGNIIFGSAEYEYTIDLEPNQELPGGGFWVEIYNDTTNCPWDCGDGNGSVATADLLALLAGWGGPGPCDFDQNGVISTADLLKLLGMWGACPFDPVDWGWEYGILDPVRGMPGFAFSLVRGNQEVWVGTPGDLSLNMLCKQEIDCTNNCGDGNVAEGEACGDLDNEGCNVDPPVFTPAACGDIICGSAWAVDGQRDTDWYLVELPDPDGDGFEELRARLRSEFNGSCFIVDGVTGVPCDPVVVASGASVACDPTGDAAACLPAPGTYAVFVAPATFDGFPCGDLTDYTVAITCGPCPLGEPSKPVDPKLSAALLAPRAK